MARKKAPRASSITRAGSTSRVRAPSAAAGTPGIDQAAKARQSTSRHHDSTLATFDISAAIAMIGTACFGPNW
jgi:hypothetical protein